MADLYRLGCIVDCERKIREAGDAIFPLTDTHYREPEARLLWEHLHALQGRVAALAEPEPEDRRRIP